MATTQFDGNRLVSLLEGRECPSCADGRLERGRYKGNEAVICDTCETPRAQLW
ncbi:HVO_A0556 family zinc finger protein [Halostagnicola larsenii]|uniref:HVO_A0556 family zinc finger protein n=1 Tax=Halostagnicola larsenii TaxID=353800 RepID=UPI00146FAB05|nr:HVO_A0556 family zinc finger protein [Halostagnicola larsenii]